MYKWAARTLIRRNIRLLNEGRYEPTLAMFASGATLRFPGDNSWSRQFREPRTRGSESSPTHVGRDQIEAFLWRYVEHGIQMEVDDALVNGPPWNTRIAIRVHDWIIDDSGDEVYANRAVLFARIRWGKIVEQEDYEDSEFVAAFDSYVERAAFSG
jgi:ketosteroid isomerase-like protein